MPRWNYESLAIYDANKLLLFSAKRFAEDNRDNGEEHAKMAEMTKYCYFNDQLTDKQLGWIKAYVKRNDIDPTFPRLSSTQSADSSTNSLS